MTFHLTYFGNDIFNTIFSNYTKTTLNYSVIVQLFLVFLRSNIKFQEHYISVNISLMVSGRLVKSVHYTFIKKINVIIVANGVFVIFVYFN